MLGPIAATRFAGRVPNSRCIASIAAAAAPSRRPAPAGVHRRDGAGDAVGHQQRNTVGRTNRNRDLRRIRYERVSLGR